LVTIKSVLSGPREEAGFADTLVDKRRASRRVETGLAVGMATRTSA